MTETLVGVSPGMEQDPAGRPPSRAELDAARELVRQAQARGVSLTGPGGLLKALTKAVIETALDEEMRNISATTDTPSRAATGVTPATGNGRRRCSPTAPARSTSRCHATGTGRSPQLSPTIRAVVKEPALWRVYEALRRSDPDGSRTGFVVRETLEKIHD